MPAWLGFGTMDALTLVLVAAALLIVTITMWLIIGVFRSNSLSDKRLAAARRRARRVNSLDSSLDAPRRGLDLDEISADPRTD